MLSLNNVSKVFYKNTVNEKTALDNINLKINKGDFISFIGTNGAGKSTLFNAICGSILIDKGCIILDNKNITGLKEHKTAKFIGRIFQNPLFGTAPNLTVEENLALSYGHSFSFKPALNAKSRQLFKDKLSMLELGLEERLKTKVGLLSGGQRQALTLLMATLKTPKLLLLDEHTAALDPKTADKIMQITKNTVINKNITTLMITHNIENSLKFGNRTIMMDNGKIILDIEGDERKNLNTQKLIKLFSEKSNKIFDNDRILFSSVKN